LGWREKLGKSRKHRRSDSELEEWTPESAVASEAFTNRSEWDALGKSAERARPPPFIFWVRPKKDLKSLRCSDSNLVPGGSTQPLQYRLHINFSKKLLDGFFALHSVE